VSIARPLYLCLVLVVLHLMDLSNVVTVHLGGPCLINFSVGIEGGPMVIFMGL